MSALVVDFFGAPGSGKSTMRAGVFHQLKLMNINCEEVPEFAKDLTWEERKFALSCQPYIFGKQLLRMERVIDKVDVVLTDSPILLSYYYGKIEGYCTYPESFYQYVRDQFFALSGGRQLNYLVTRVKPYNPVGRNETEEQSNAIAVKMKSMLEDLRIAYHITPGNDVSVQVAVMDVLTRLHQHT